MRGRRLFAAAAAATAWGRARWAGRQVRRPRTAQRRFLLVFLLQMRHTGLSDTRLFILRSELRMLTGTNQREAVTFQCLRHAFELLNSGLTRAMQVRVNIADESEGVKSCLQTESRSGALLRAS